MNVEMEYIRNIGNLVPCPEIALEVMELAHAEECNVSLLSGTVEKDPNLTANMLRMANSAYFGHMRKITSIPDIIARLGLESIRIIAITSASVGLLNSPQNAYNLEPGALWRHSYATAIFASIAGRYAKLRDNSALYTAALLHDIGKVILNRPLQAEMLNRAEVEPSKPLIEFERILLHTDHARVGMALLEQWGLPVKISVPVGFHHCSDQAKTNQLAAQIIEYANIVVESIGMASEDGLNQPLTLQGYLDEKKNLPGIPGVEENMEAIIDDFFTKINDNTTLDFEVL